MAQAAQGEAQTAVCGICQEKQATIKSPYGEGFVDLCVDCIKDFSKCANPNCDKYAVEYCSAMENNYCKTCLPATYACDKCGRAVLDDEHCPLCF